MKVKTTTLIVILVLLSQAFGSQSRHPIRHGNESECADCTTRPQATFSPDPEYPPEERSNFRDGTVTLNLIVGTDGLPRTVSVAESLSPAFDAAAVDAVKRWKFSPATRAGKPVPVQIVLQVTFHRGPSGGRSRHYDGPVWFQLSFGLVMLCVVAAYVVWDRRYRRMWQQSRARHWQPVGGRFDEGEIVTMMKGRPKSIAGYQVWLGYDYEARGEQVGIYTLPFVGEFPSEAAAEECRKRIANQPITIRMSPRNPKRSCVLDEDVSPYIRDQQ
jgi:TonB family protein